MTAPTSSAGSGRSTGARGRRVWGGRGGRRRRPPPPPPLPPRRAARFRVYRSAILRRHAPSALLRPYTHHVWGPLDRDAMRAALARLVGTHDFRAFRALGTPTKTSRCALLHAELTEREDLRFLTF